MSEPKKKKWPRQVALDVGKEIHALIRPLCERATLAGSIRRRRPFVSDIEVLYVPKMGEERDGLFDVRPISLVDAKLEELLKAGVIAKRKNVLGGEIWGSCNKLAIHIASGIPIDFFATKTACFFNYLTCRTGPKESNIRVATAAKKKGWTWHPYDRGFTTATGRWVDVDSEEAVFALVGLTYKQPWERG